jgi:hypothetical protein
VAELTTGYTALLLTAALLQTLGAQEAEYASPESAAQITSAMSAVDQSSLDDYSVAYTLVVALDDPKKARATRTHLS